MDNSSIAIRIGGKTFWRTIGLVIVGSVLIYAANAFGFWWFTILVGCLLGVLLQRGRIAFLAALLIGCAGWGAGLAYQSFFLPISQVATITAGIVGLGTANGWLMFVVTLLVGALLCVCGAWFGFALKSFLLQCVQLRSTTNQQR